MIVTTILFSVPKPLNKWFGADGQNNKMSFNYVDIFLGCSVVSCIFLMFCCTFQAKERTALLSIFQISSFLMTMFFFHLGTFGVALTTVVSEAISGIV